MSDVNTPTMALPPLAVLHQDRKGSWLATCLGCPGHTLPRRVADQAVADAHDHWQVWHSTKEERA